MLRNTTGSTILMKRNHLTTCVAQLAKASDMQAVGRGFEPHPHH